MAILSTLLSVAKPTGMWESIIWAFESFTNNYVWAVVLITVIIRILWSPLDTYNRRITSKNAAMQAKMQPELQKVQEKYGHDKQLLNQKTNEVYKKYNYNMMGSCGFMLVFMVLNLVIFFTLFSGLNAISSYKIYDNYDNLKENYANCLNLIDANENNTKIYLDNFNAQDKKDLEFRVFMDGENKLIGLFDKTAEETNKETALTYDEYLTLEDFKEKDELDPSVENDVKRANDVIKAIVEKFGNDEHILIQEVKEGDQVVTAKVTLLDAVTSDAMGLIEFEYKETQESFLWIKNIWIADSPFKTSIFDYKGFESMVGAKNIEAGEDTIYNAFMPSLSKSQGAVNGYFILPVLIIGISFLSMWLSSFLMSGKKKGDKQAAKQGKIMQIIMPIIMGVFAIFYNAVFAIYMLVSQLISTALLPLQQLIVKKIDAKAEKKEQQKLDNKVDYRRKF